VSHHDDSEACGRIRHRGFNVLGAHLELADRRPPPEHLHVIPGMDGLGQRERSSTGERRALARLHLRIAG